MILQYRNTTHLSDNIELIKKLPDSSVDAIITDSPYGLGKEPNAAELVKAWIDHGYLEIKGKGFMGRSWDAFVPQPILWKECFRVLKPGGHLLSFFGTRTYDWGTLAIRLAGFEIRDCIMWVYGSGFPKSMDISKAIDSLGKENKEAIRAKKDCGLWLRSNRQKIGFSLKDVAKHFPSVTGGLTGCVSNWELGNLPTWEHFNKLKKILSLTDVYDYLIDGRPKDNISAEREVIGTKLGNDAKKVRLGMPLQDSTLKTYYDITTPSTDAAKKYEGFGTALKPAFEPICVARKPLEGTVANNVLKYGTGGMDIDTGRIPFENDQDLENATWGRGTDILGANYVGAIHSSGKTNIEANNKGRWPANIIHDGSDEVLAMFPDAMGQQGLAKSDGSMQGNKIYGKLNHGTINPEPRNDTGTAARFFYCAKTSPSERANAKHPTIKPLALMAYLIKLFCPIDGILLEPHMGSGTTCIAAALNDRFYIGIDNDPESFDEANRRIKSELGMFA